MKNLFVLFVLLLSSTMYGQDTKTITLYFPANGSELNEGQKRYLESEAKGYWVISSVGYANSLKPEFCDEKDIYECNFYLAEFRSSAISDVDLEYYPWGNGINSHGEVIKGGNARDRRVEIHLQKKR